MDVTQPRQSSPSPRLDGAEADRIAAVYDVRSYPLPPGGLLQDGLVSEDLVYVDPGIHDRYEGAAERAVAPHWNSAVDLLRGPEGYHALVRLRDRLAGHVSELVHEADQRSLPAGIARAARRVLTYEAERHGPDSKIGASLDGRPPSPDEDGWTWEPRWSWGQKHKAVVPGARPALLALRSSHVDDLVALCEREDKETFVEFDRDSTWAQAAERASSNESRFTRAGLNRDDEVVDLVEFRLKVVEQVLREHEILGHVAEFVGGAERRVRLSEEQADFVRRALAAVLTAEAEAERGEAAAPNWDTVTKRITATDESWGSSRIMRVATELGAFERGAGSARPKAPQVRARYERFRERVRALARTAGAGEDVQG